MSSVSRGWTDRVILAECGILQADRSLPRYRDFDPIEFRLRTQPDHHAWIVRGKITAARRNVSPAAPPPTPAGGARGKRYPPPAAPYRRPAGQRMVEPAGTPSSPIHRFDPPV